jgi:hypothetical protein
MRYSRTLVHIVNCSSPSDLLLEMTFSEVGTGSVIALMVSAVFCSALALFKV